MKEEIDIIELLKRVKEGKAPQKIQICNNVFYLNMGEHDGYISSLYYDVNNNYEEIKDENMIEWTSIESIKLDTKIKILEVILRQRSQKDQLDTLKEKIKEKKNKR